MTQFESVDVKEFSHHYRHCTFLDGCYGGKSLDYEVSP